MLKKSFYVGVIIWVWTFILSLVIYLASPTDSYSELLSGTILGGSLFVALIYALIMLTLAIIEEEIL